LDDPRLHLEDHASVRDGAAVLGILVIRRRGVAAIDGHVDVGGALVLVNRVSEGLVLAIIGVGPALVVANRVVFFLGIVEGLSQAEGAAVRVEAEVCAG